MVNWIMPLRIAQASVGVVVLGFASYVSSWWANYWREMSPVEFNFLIFSAVWTLLALAYVVIAPLYFPRIAHKFATLGADALTMTFWFGGFVALAVFLSSRVCFGNVCSVAKAAVGFAALEWLLFAVSTGYTAMFAFRVPRRAQTVKELEIEGPMRPSV